MTFQVGAILGGEEAGFFTRPGEHDVGGVAVLQAPPRRTNARFAGGHCAGYLREVKTRHRAVNRRKFLLGSVALAAGASGVWTATSSTWTARFFRERLAEVGRAIPAAPHRPDPDRWSEQAITLTWLGHASVLVNFFGMWVLVDPTFYPRIGVNVGLGVLGPQRLVASALTPGDLPEIDAVVVSHAHFDHLDIPSLRAVRGRPTLITAPATADLIPRRPYASVVELPWGQTHRVVTGRGELRVRSLEVKHWGARIRRDTHRGYNGYVLEREGHRLLLGGDTADTPLFAGHRRHGPFAAAVMPVGAYDPWIQNHCTPEQAVEMARAAGARFFVPIHHQSFKLSREPVNEPLERTQAALAAEPERLVLEAVGQTAVVYPARAAV